MHNTILKFFILLFIVLTLTSCNDYQKILRSEDVGEKYKAAEEYYENEEWRRASNLFEQISPKYRGRPQAERVTFFYANSLLNTKNYVLAAFKFEEFVKAYPMSQKVEEAAYLGAYCYYKQSPVLTLTQEKTQEAIEKLQQFINFYPYSEKLNDASDLVQELRIKLEEKAFEIAKQYNTIRDYKSSIIVLNSFISDYPGTPFREDALYYLFDSSYKLAINSIPSLRLERLEDAKKIYDELLTDYPETSYLKDAEKKILDIDKEITIFAGT
ncbi:MAG: outer membrane protein assembly factor BamD [Flavobacteriaceae bacterium]